MLGTRTNFNTALYNCATECALRRFGRKCKSVFGSRACDNCQYNVNRYINADPRHVELFMMEAENRAAELRYRSHPSFLAILIVGLFIGLLVWAWVKQNNKYKMIIQAAASRSNPTLSNVPDDPIRETMYKVARYLRDGKDVNNDGKVNCIDAAVLFYKYFPDKSKVTIEVNYNPSRDFNHAFNCVLINGVWRAVEPQTVWKNRDSYWMRDFWGSQYDPSFNEDQTVKWKVYAK